MKKIIILTLFLVSGCTLKLDQISCLSGQGKDFVLSKMGKPTVIRTEFPNQLWTYQKQGCSILVFFDQSETVQFTDFYGSCP